MGALVQLLANSGVRAAEILQEPRDSRRDDLTWGDVQLVEDGEDVIHVLGKDQTTNDVVVPSTVRESLLRMRQELERRFGDVPDDWTVFPTRHRPRLSRAARSQLGDDVIVEKPGAPTELHRHKNASTTKQSYGGAQQKEVREVVDELRSK